jgi:hypothetical protein
MVYTGYAKTALGLGTSYNSYCVLDLHHHHLFVCVGGVLRNYTLSHSTCPFCDEYFQDRVSQTICLG